MIASITIARKGVALSATRREARDGTRRALKNQEQAAAVHQELEQGVTEDNTNNRR